VCQNALKNQNWGPATSGTQGVKVQRKKQVETYHNHLSCSESKVQHHTFAHLLSFIDHRSPDNTIPLQAIALFCAVLLTHFSNSDYFFGQE